MYEAAYPDDDEIDQVQWKAFWSRNQIYHTICLSCITKRKEQQRGAGAGPAPSGTYKPFDDDKEQYPDWGPVFLTPASKAILLNWYRKAQRVRAGKKGAKKAKEPKVITDSDEEEVPPEWTKQMEGITPASSAIAIKWMRTARAALQKRAGKGGSINAAKPNTEAFRGGKKSKMLKK